MAGLTKRLATYFKTEFAPEKLKWERIVADEKQGRGCPSCSRFGFYIHLPTSIREYWWGFYRCKGCKTEYRPRFTKGNLLFLALMAFFYFNYFGQRGFTYRSYLNMAIAFAFVLGVNFIYSRLSRTGQKLTCLLLGLGGLLAWAQVAWAHHGEGVANLNPKDIIYLTGSTIGFTLAGGSLIGLFPGVQTSIEDLLDFLLNDESEPWVDKEALRESVLTPDEKSEGPPEAPPGEEGRPEWLDPEYEREQLEWWRSNLEDEKVRLDSYRRNRQNDPDFQERVKDMQRSIDYYRKKLSEQQERMGKYGVTPGEQRPVSQWDPFQVSDWEREVQEEANRRQRWDEAWQKFEKMRTGAEKRGHDLYGDPAKWDKAMDRIFKDDGEVDYEVLDKARTVFQRSIDADIDTMAPEHRHWVSDAAIKTVRDAKNNPVIRIGAAIVFQGASEAVFEPLDQLERMHDYVQYHDKGTDKDLPLTSWLKASGHGLKELAKDKFMVRELQTIFTGQVEMPDGTTRKAKGMDYVMSLVGVGLKGKDWHSTVGKGKFWEVDAFNIRGRKQVEDISGPQGKLVRRPVGRIEGNDVQVRGTADEAGVRSAGGGIEADGPGARGGAAAGGGPPKGPKIPPEMAEDYNAMQRAIAAGDEAGANRHATRMLVKNYEEFQKMVGNKTIDGKTAGRAVRTHQQIVAEGSARGMERTKNMGKQLQDEIHIDETGKMTVNKAIKNTWSPGSAMEDFKEIKRVPGDTDLTPNVNRKLLKARGLDPDDVQSKAADHIEDGINQRAREVLGDDIGRDYCGKTKVKVMRPGSAEEYHSFKSHDLEGRAIDSDGKISDHKTSLGEEQWPGMSREVTDAVNQSKTGRAMVAADEHFQINKNVREFDTHKKPTLAEKTELARDLAKHHGRLEEGANWKADDLDGSKLQLDKEWTPAEKLSRFQETLEAAKKGDPDAIDQAVKKNYGGDYREFYEDIRQSSKQGTQTRLDQGGKVYDAQADRLQQTGVKVGKDNVIRPPSGSEDRKQVLDRMGVEPDLRKLLPKEGQPSLKTPEAQEAYTKLMGGEQPEGFGPPKSEPMDDVVKRANVETVPSEDQLQARRLSEQVEALKEKDPVFKDLDNRIDKAINEGRDRRHQEIRDQHIDQLESEKKWGPPESDAFQEELGKRMKIDQRLEDPTTVKYQEHRLVQKGVTRQQLNKWLEVRENLRDGKPVEPLEPFSEPDSTSWAPYKEGESPFRPDEPAGKATSPDPGQIAPGFEDTGRPDTSGVRVTSEAPGADTGAETPPSPQPSPQAPPPEPSSGARPATPPTGDNGPVPGDEDFARKMQDLHEREQTLLQKEQELAEKQQKFMEFLEEHRKKLEE